MMNHGLIGFALTAMCLALHAWLVGKLGDAHAAAILSLCILLNLIALLRPSASRSRLHR